jgi:MoxR-like ATPase
MAIKENIFLMLICIVNKIPLFLSGNPGCSKTSSINIIIDALKGKDAIDPLL